MRTVVEVLGERGNGVDLRVEPAFSQSQLFEPFAASAVNSFSQIEAARVGKLRQIIFTPQQPVDVFVMEFTR